MAKKEDLTISKFTYTKDDGSTSERKLAVVSDAPAQNLRALDLSDYDDDTANKILFVYTEWVKNVKKPFDKKAREFQAENLMSFEAYLREHEFADAPDSMLKSFKVQGLSKVAA